MICANCGKEISDGSKFCGFCGSKVEVAAAPVYEPAPVPFEVTPAEEPVAEPASVEMPVAEEVAVEPVVEQPAPVEMPAAEQPAPIEMPAAEQPAPIEMPVAEQPVMNAAPVQPNGPQGMPAPMQPNAPQGMPAPMQPNAPQGMPAPMQPNAPQGMPAPMQPNAPQGMPVNMQPNGPQGMAPNMQPVPPVSNTNFQPGVPAPKDPKKKKSKAPLIIILVLVVVLLLAGGALVFMWMNRPINKIEKAFAAGDIATVTELYGDLKSDKDIDQVKSWADDYVAQLKEDYLNGEKDYKTVSKELNSLSKTVLKGDKNLAKVMELVEAVNDSEAAFEKAEQYKEDGDYLAAIEEYNNISDSAEELAEKKQDAIAECEKLYRDDVIAQADSYLANEEYDAARAILEEAYNVLGDDESISAKISEIEEIESSKAMEAAIDEALTAAESAMAEGRYAEAQNIVSNALTQYPDSKELTAKLEEINTIMESMSVSDGTIVGTWSLTYDMGPMLSDELGDDFEGFVSSLPLLILFELNEDGTCRMYADAETFKTNFEEWEAAFVEYSMDMMYAMFEEYGLSKEDAEEMMQEEYGYGMKEYMYSILDEELDTDELISKMETTGVYKVDGDKIYMASTVSELEYANYDIFTIAGDALTITAVDGDEEEVLPGLSYPLTFYRFVEEN